MVWQDLALTGVDILSKAGKTCVIEAGEGWMVTRDGEAIPTEIMQNGAIAFETVRGGRYTLVKIGI
jgi:hypothetical protein